VQIAEEIRHLIDAYTKPVPSVLEIPSKDMPYDPSKDTILKRAQVPWLSPEGSRHHLKLTRWLRNVRAAAAGACRTENVHQ